MELSWKQRWLLVRAWLMLVLVAAGLALFGLRRLRPALLPGVCPAPSRMDLPEAQSFGRIVHGAASWSPLRATCLAQSLVLCRLLRGQGLAAELRIGVLRAGETISAHAWVEHGGVALGEPMADLERFSSFNTDILTRGV